MSAPWMPFYIGDYLKDTSRLSTAEHGAYLLLIFEYWQTGSLPDDDDRLARIVKMNVREWKKARPIISAFFQSGWQHKRLDKELAKSRDISEKRRGAAKAMHETHNVIVIGGRKK